MDWKAPGEEGGTRDRDREAFQTFKCVSYCAYKKVDSMCVVCLHTHVQLCYRFSKTRMFPFKQCNEDEMRWAEMNGEWVMVWFCEKNTYTYEYIYIYNKYWDRKRLNWRYNNKYSCRGSIDVRLCVWLMNRSEPGSNISTLGPLMPGNSTR